MWHKNAGVSIAVIVLNFAACASTARKPDTASYKPAASNESLVIVSNDNITEMDIYALEGYSRWRLGAVPAGRTATLRIPSALLVRPDIQLQADPLGPVAPFTLPRVPLEPGSALQLHVASALPMSTVVW